MITFQKLVQRLSLFWEKRGCIIHHGHDLEVGAGTFNPATFLRCLGPEPYRTAYVEPSRRPSDGRYGENPNRVQLFHQYQVIIKPSPADIQQLYLQSLEAVGIKLKEHDIRFVHSDWESPTLGAWGLGWEVWCDGMEVSQFTYFQAIGSLPLKPVSVEITYGLERLAMYIQNVDSLFDVHWNEELTFGDIAKRSEVEWSAYNFTEASTEMWKRHFDDFEKEAKDLVCRNLPIPAYDFVLKASHAFNILDARGVISVTERTGYIARVRDLARLIAVEYLASRESQGFPLLKEKKEPQVTKKTSKIAGRFNPEKCHDFLLEIGSEELPDSFIPGASADLDKRLRHFFETHGLSYQALHIYAAPRRLSALVEGLAEGSHPKIMERRGPTVKAAFNDQGHPTPQGEGFFKSFGFSHVSLEKLHQGKIKNLEIRGEHLFALIPQPGCSTRTLLAQHLPSLILQIDFPKQMHWGDLDISYARPLHWIVALFGEKVIPFQVGNISSGRFSFGHAQRAPKKFALTQPKEYLSLLKKHFVLADEKERKQVILDQLHTLEKEVKGHALESSKVLEQVTNLVEWPELAAVTFDPAFLRIPSEVLICEMVEHQKYFPIADKAGKLTNHFIITADNTPTDLVRKGNQKVLSARLNDGVFLYNQDLKATLAHFNEKLKAMTFQKELGSMFEKVQRLTAHVITLNKHLSLADDSTVLRAALLCKADLSSNLVGEFPELQGVIGKYYALAEHEPQEVAQAIEEHWMPLAEGAPLPQTPSGIILSLADKIDNLLGYFSVGLKPSSSSDPYALRRQALGLLKILIEGKHSLNLKLALEECAAHFPKIGPSVIADILSFITARAKSLFEEFGFKKDEIDASLQGVCLHPYAQFCKTQAVHTFRNSGEAFAKLFEVYKRAKGQLEKPTSTPFSSLLAQTPAEKALVHQLEIIQREWKSTLQEDNYTHAFHLIASLQPPLAHLFDTVKILDDDLKLRENRIALLQQVFSHFHDLLDFSKIQS